MGLVHSGTGRLGRSGVPELVSLGSGRVPESSIVCGRNVKILGNVFDPRRETINTFARRQTKGDLIQLALRTANTPLNNLPLTWSCVE